MSAKLNDEGKTEFTLRDGKTLHISEAGPQDAAALIDYVNRAGGETDFLTFGKNEFWLSVDQEEAFLRELQPTSGWMLKGVVENRIVSTLSLLRTNRPRLKHIGELGISVLKDSWGKGVGEQMCKAAIDLAIAGGVRKINLCVREDNTRAIRLYERLGFEKEGHSSRAYFVGGKYFSQDLMGLCLG